MFISLLLAPFQLHYSKDRLRQLTEILEAVEAIEKVNEYSPCQSPTVSDPHSTLSDQTIP